MDTAVALVEAYLNVNGYFTVCEYPILEVLRGGDVQSATDFDILAFRFARAAREMPSGGRRRAIGTLAFRPDPALDVPPARPDMIIGEVKEGRARFNDAARDPFVLAAALARFGCCDWDHAPGVIARLLKHGAAITPCGHRVRMVAFGSEPATEPCRKHVVIGIAQILRYLDSYLTQHWKELRKVQLKHPILGLLQLARKAGAGDRR